MRQMRRAGIRLIGSRPISAKPDVSAPVTVCFPHRITFLATTAKNVGSSQFTDGGSRGDPETFRAKLV